LTPEAPDFKQRQDTDPKDDIKVRFYPGFPNKISVAPAAQQSEA